MPKKKLMISIEKDLFKLMMQDIKTIGYGADKSGYISELLETKLRKKKNG
jgi:hypothetical protein